MVDTLADRLRQHAIANECVTIAVRMVGAWWACRHRRPVDHDRSRRDAHPRLPGRLRQSELDAPTRIGPAQLIAMAQGCAAAEAGDRPVGQIGTARAPQKPRKFFFLNIRRCLELPEPTQTVLLSQENYVLCRT
jgi:hypothetical protein